VHPIKLKLFIQLKILIPVFIEDIKKSLCSDIGDIDTNAYYVSNVTVLSSEEDEHTSIGKMEVEIELLPSTPTISSTEIARDLCSKIDNFDLEGYFNEYEIISVRPL
jgi:hypothetical protein